MKKLKAILIYSSLAFNFLILFFIFLITFCSCAKKDNLEEITFVLDWTPNTNHTGLYVAKDLNYFQEENINIKIINPGEDGALPVVGSGSAQFGVDFQDSFALACSSESSIQVTAIAAVLQHNTSGLISLKEKNIIRPKDLENKNYAGWDHPIEEQILKTVIENDGGEFKKLNLIHTSLADITLLFDNKIDVTWGYYGWQKIAADLHGADTNFIYFKDYNKNLDYYTPIIIANNNYLNKNENQVKRFLKALKKGYLYAIEFPEKSAEILLKNAPELNKNLVLKSQEYISKEYKSETEAWGIINKERWENFNNWLLKNNIITRNSVNFTNEYLDF